MLVTSEPMPISVTISAASATDPPSWRTVSAITGRIAPSPRPNRNDGPECGDGDLAQAEGVVGHACGRFRGRVRASLAAPRRAAYPPSRRAALSSPAAGRSRPRDRPPEGTQWPLPRSARLPRDDSAGVDAALLILRIVLGGLILVHGLSKLPPPPDVHRRPARQGGSARSARLRRLPRRDRRAGAAHHRRLDSPGAVVIVDNMLFAVALVGMPQLFKLNQYGGYALELDAMFLFTRRRAGAHGSRPLQRRRPLRAAQLSVVPSGLRRSRRRGAGRRSTRPRGDR